MSGRAVRLRQGRVEERTEFPEPPEWWAARWDQDGADWLHVVDLDAAFSGRPENHAAVRAIVAAVRAPVQLGGGMRTREDIVAAFEIGVARVILGTRAAESLGFVAEAVREFGAGRIAVGIDAKDGFVAVKGWTESSPRRALDLARQAAMLGVGAIIYTDIATDGMMRGPNLPALEALLSEVDVPVIASGGVSSHDDLRALAARRRLHGAIIGRALYDGMVSLAGYRASSGFGS